MALAVCYSHRLENHLQRPAIYLEQTFYALIFNVCRADIAKFPILSQMASLRYKSPTMIVEPSRVASLRDELESLRILGHAHHQISSFADVVTRAVTEKCTLTVHGDMFPELPLCPHSANQEDPPLPNLSAILSSALPALRHLIRSYIPRTPMPAQPKHPEISIESLEGYTEDAESRRAFLWSYYGIVWLATAGLATAGFVIIVGGMVLGYLRTDLYRELAVVACLVAMFLGLVRACRSTPRSTRTGKPMQPYRNASAPEGVVEIIYVDHESRTYFRHTFAVPSSDD